MQALAFSIKRGGLLYGTVDDEGHISVHAIYEPPQVEIVGYTPVLTRRSMLSSKSRYDYVQSIYKPPQRFISVESMSVYSMKKFCRLRLFQGSILSLVT